MPEIGLGTACTSQRRKAAPNPLNPDLMADRERLAEVASLLAAGFLRCWLHKAPQSADVGLAIPRTSSEVCVCPPEADKPKSEGEKSL